MTKSRKIRKLVRKNIKKNVPRSSRNHRFIYACSRERKRLLNDQVNYFMRKHTCKSTMQKRLENRENIKHVFRRSARKSSILNQLATIQNNIDTAEHSFLYIINSPCMTVNYNFAKH